MPNQSDPNQNSPLIPTVPIAADLPPLPPEFQKASSETQNKPDQATQGSAAPVNTTPPSFSPIVSGSPKKKFGGGRIIATILGILLLVGGVGAGILLTRQNQDVREKAYTQVWGGEVICDLVKLTAVEDPSCPEQSCEVRGEDDIVCKYKNDLAPPGNYYSTTFTLSNLTDQPRTVEFTKYAYYCPTYKYGDDNGICLQNEQKEDGSITLQPGESKNYKSEITGLLAAGKSCGTYQTDFSVKSIDGKSDCRSNEHGLALGFGMCKTGRNCQSEWTPQPSPTLTPDTAQCLNVKAYNSTWAPLTTTQLSTSAPNTVVNFCVAGSTTGGSFDKAQFQINTNVLSETTTTNPNVTSEFCQEYTIKATDKNVSVKAKVHHVNLDQWFGETF
jgi:hypothetical protein